MQLKTFIEFSIHFIEHWDDFHRCQLAASWREANDIAEEDGAGGENLAQVHHWLATAQPVGDLFRYHLVEQQVGSLHFNVEFLHAFLERFSCASLVPAPASIRPIAVCLLVLNRGWNRAYSSHWCKNQFETWYQDFPNLKSRNEFFNNAF